MAGAQNFPDASDTGMGIAVAEEHRPFPR